jgi:hypothetical protein
MVKNRIEKSEYKYLILSAITAFIFTLIIMSNKVIGFLTGLNPVFQFLILNIGFYLVFFFFFKGIVLHKKKMWKGVMGTVIGFIAVDLLLPEYHVTSKGLVEGGLFGASASDYFFGYIYHILHIDTLFALIINAVIAVINTFLAIPYITANTALILLVYPITFIGLFILGAYLVKNFVHNL